jgi:RND family efflux transporter MFP subunit
MGGGRRGAVLGAVGVAAILILMIVRLFQLLGDKHHDPAKSAVPTVSVTSATLTTAPTTVSIIGTIAARYDMPIGVEGDGGRVAAIYVEAGDRVKRGQILARLNVSVLQPQVGSLEATLEQSRAEAELAQAEYHRAEKVGASGALSAEETERRRSTALTAASKVKVAAAQLAEARARLARTDIRAPADGNLLTRNIEVGQTASPGGEALFRLAQGGEMELRGEVAEQDLPLLKVGQAVDVRLTGIAQSFVGHIRLMGAVIDPKSRLGSVRVSLSADPNLRPGAFARAAVTVSNAQRAVLPQTAVLTDDKGSYVLVVDSHNRVKRRTVHVSGIVPDGVTIAEGLADHDRVVTAAGAFLQEGELIKPLSDGRAAS